MSTNLDNHVRSYAHKGFTVESRTDTQAVLTKKQTIGWFWNIILSFVTCGLWLLVVLYRLINRKHDRIILTMDENGSVRKQ